VTIVKSDYPNGEFGFVGQTELRIENPSELRIISVTVDRAAGLLGKQLVSLPCTWYMCVTGHVDLDSQEGVMSVTFYIRSLQQTFQSLLSLCKIFAP